MSKRKRKVSVGEVISVTPGQRHAWFKSNVGPVRKPVSVRYNPLIGKNIIILK